MSQIVPLVNIDNRKRVCMIKTYSFTTDDDENETQSTILTIPNHYDTYLSSKMSSSIRKIQKGDSFENNKQIRQRKFQQKKQNSIESRHTSNSKCSHLKKDFFFNFLKFFGLFLTLYLIWIRRDLWFNQFLISNNRIHRLNNTKELNESFLLTKSSSNNEDDNNITIEEQSSKLNLKLRTNKNSSSKTNIHLSNYKHLIKQIQENLQSHVHEQNFYKILYKSTGLTKNQIDRFIFRNDHQNLTLQTLISILDLFNLMIFIVPK